jgi:hypothetical protein
MRYTSLLESRIYNQVCYPLLRIDVTNCKAKNFVFNINGYDYEYKGTVLAKDL